MSTSNSAGLMLTVLPPPNIDDDEFEPQPDIRMAAARTVAQSVRVMVQDRTIVSFLFLKK
jgi:hypothetical protein